MQFLLSGAIAHQGCAAAESAKDTDPQPEDWICKLCSAKNRFDLDDEYDTDKCGCCSRQRLPPWLLLCASNLQLDLGVRVMLPGESSSSAAVGVISGVDYFKRHLELLTISNRVSYRSTGQAHAQREVHSASGRKSKLRFELLTLDETQLQRLVPIAKDEDQDIQELVATLEQQGLCGECRRVFRIAQGDPQQEYSSRDAIEKMQHEMARCQEHKAQHIKLKQYDRVVECTSTLKTMTQQLSVLKRNVENMKSVSCPHCGWVAKDVK